MYKLSGKLSIIVRYNGYCVKVGTKKSINEKRLLLQTEQKQVSIPVEKIDEFRVMKKSLRK